MSVGLYIHIPFCAGKCPYCDFFSTSGSEELFDRYTDAVIRQLRQLERETADTVYFGGGTPSLMGEKRLGAMLDAAAVQLDIPANAEITAEINPGDASEKLLSGMRAAGFNRISMGVQSGVDSELKSLGRRHDTAQARRAALLVRAAGFDNMSLDLMLAIPGQTEETLEQSVDFVCGLAPEHVSAYILKIEENTPFFAMRDRLGLPGDDGQAELYLAAVRLLEQRGYAQYEISNFSLPGRESRHNLKYWHGEEYIGIGPAAHSFYHGRRYYYLRDLESFLNAPQTVYDGEGGSAEEYIMLALRLSEGLTEAGFRLRFGADIPQPVRKKARIFEKAGLLTQDENGIRLTVQGFLVSNAVIAELLEEI